MVAVRHLKDVMTLSVFKPRYDDYTDQYSRIFMTKLMLMASIIMGVDYFSDQVNCMVPNNARHSKDFYHAACWISGYYIYDEMGALAMLHKSGYYGIPQRVDYDGIDKRTHELCHTKDLYENVEDCIPMTRIYYLHYQWMPVYMASLSVLFYIPYILFRLTNSDLISLKKEIRKVSHGDTSPILRNFFNYAVNPRCQLRIRIVWNILVKMLYVLVGCSTFLSTNYLLHGKYLTYGIDYLDWYRQNNTLRHAAVSKSVRANAGNVLLPSMGFCDIHESSLEKRMAFHNKNRFICEISPHIMYQYVFMVLWFFFISSILVSLMGLMKYIFTFVACESIYCTKGKFSMERAIIKSLTLREIEYLGIVKQTSMAKYGDLLTRLKQQRLGEEKTVEKGCDLAEELEKFITSFNI